MSPNSTWYYQTLLLGQNLTSLMNCFRAVPFDFRPLLERACVGPFDSHWCFALCCFQDSIFWQQIHRSRVKNPGKLIIIASLIKLTNLFTRTILKLLNLHSGNGKYRNGDKNTQICSMTSILWCSREIKWLTCIQNVIWFFFPG